MSFVLDHMMHWHELFKCIPECIISYKIEKDMVVIVFSILIP